MNVLKFIVSAKLNAQRIVLLSVALGVLACGQSGPLFLPKAPEPLKARVEPPKNDSKDDSRNDVKAAGAKSEPTR